MSHLYTANFAVFCSTNGMKSHVLWYQVVHMFRGCKSEDMPPHIYSLAQSAYNGMLASRRDQSIVLLGRSGSGKTTNFKHVLHYLVLAAGALNKVPAYILHYYAC